MSGPLFLANLGLVVVALLATIVAGRKSARVPHYSLAVSTLLLLGIAIWQAELYGRNFAFEAIRLHVHLTCATAALLAVPGVVWSGIALARGRGARRAHRLWVAGFVVLAGMAMATAGWMFLSAERKDGGTAPDAGRSSGAILGAGEQAHRMGDLGGGTGAS